MDISQLCLALQYTLSNVKEQRESATTFLQQAQTQHGFVSALLQIATDSSVQVAEHVRQAAAVQLKNVLKKHWKVPEDAKQAETFVISAEEKQFLRENIFLFMVKSGIKVVHSQLESCLILIGEHEFPEGWPMILGQIKSTLLTANDPKAVHAALTAIYCLTKLYKYELTSKRKNLDLVINELYSCLYQIATKLAATPSEQSACFLKLIAKSFATAINVEISPLLTKEETFTPWLDTYRTAFSWTVDPSLETITEDEEVVKERKKSEVLKMKKAIAHIFYRIFQKYGNPKFAQKSYVKFAKLVEEKYAHALLTINLQVLEEAKTKFVHPHILSLALRFITQAVKHPKLNSAVRSSLNEILQNCAFPRLLISPANAAIWDEDPHEFLKILFEEEELYDYDPRFAALMLLDAACSEEEYYDPDKDPYHPVLGEFLGFLGGVLDKSMKENQARVFDAALYAIGKLEEEIEKYDVLVDHVEPMIKQYVLSNIENPIGIIRMRCCWIYSQFAAVPLKDHANLLLAFQRVVKCLKDKDLPVRVMAALAVAKLVQKESIAEQIKPYVTEIISTYLSLMAEIELEDLVSALDNIIKTFDEAIKPYAVDLVKELIATYNRMYEHSKGKEGKDWIMPESGMAAAACIDAIGSILQIIGHNQTMLQQVEPLLLPIVLRSFTPDELYIMDSTVDILAELTYYSHKISPNLWELYPLLIDITVGMPEEVAAKDNVKKEGSWAYDNLKDLVISLQNFITRDPDGFLTGTCPKGRYIELMFMLIGRIIEISKYKNEESEAIMATKLLITMLEGLKGKLDPYFEAIMKIILNELNVAKEKLYRKMLLQAVSMCCWNSLEKTVAFLEATGLTEATFKLLFAETENLKEDYEIRRMLYGLTTMIEESHKLPPGGLPHIYKTLTKLSAKLMEINEKDSSSSSDSELSDGEYEKALHKLSALREKKEAKESEMKDEEASESESDIEIEEDDEMQKEAGDFRLYYSPLDSVHELYYVKMKLEELAKKDIAMYKQLEAALTEEERKQFNAAMVKADEYQKNTLEEIEGTV